MMDSVYYETINSKQNFNNKEVCFDPDSSPDAWVHYNKHYNTNEGIFKDYRLDQPSFFSYVFDKEFKKFNYGIKDESGDWCNYANYPKSGVNRLYALSEKNDALSKNGCEFFKAQLRLGGETDFNFNAKHCVHFEKIMRKEFTAKKLEENLQCFEKCKNFHHTLLNFSLMQTMGNMQGFKGGRCNDRLDSFLFHLNNYYNTNKEGRNVLPIISCVYNFANGNALNGFLSSFESVYEYCEKFYFINDEDFIDKMVKNGEKNICTAEDVSRYMKLAIEFWAKKEEHFTK